MNKVVDALSHLHENENNEVQNMLVACFSLVTKPSFELLRTLREKNKTLLDLIQLQKQFSEDVLSFCCLINDGLLYNNCFYISPNSIMKSIL